LLGQLHRVAIPAFSFSTTKVRNIFQICKDLSKYFSSISLIFSMNVSARFLGLNNLPLFAGKGMLLGNKVGLFLRKESLFRGGSRGGRDGKTIILQY